MISEPAPQPHAVVELGLTCGRRHEQNPNTLFRTKREHLNYEHIYLRPAARQQSAAVVGMLRALVEHYALRPHLLPDAGEGASPGSSEALHDAVAYVAGMTDRFACRRAVTLLDWPIDQLPNGIDP